MSTSEHSGLDQQAVLAALQALKAGDFAARLPAGAEGTAGEIAQTFNELAALLADVTSEVIRISQELGSVSRLGGQAEVEGVSGTWLQMQDEFNLMAQYLTYQLRVICSTARLNNGTPIDFGERYPARGEMNQVVGAVNALIAARAK